ncbi:MAG: fatty acid desaturase family protein [Ilumatobacteraceae bacterium]
MPTELADTVADDSTLPLFAVPAEIRQWGARVRLADRNAVRATAMLVETAVLYSGLVIVGESIDRWWGWVIAWIGLTVCMMRIDAVHHEAVHRSLFTRRLPNDLIGCITGTLEGFHGPTYRCFHLSHHALTRRDDRLSDPEGFYDEMLTRPHSFGPLRVGARSVLIVGVLLGGVSFASQLVVSAVSTLAGRPPTFVGGASLERHVRRWGLLPFALWTGAIAAAVLTGHIDHLVCWWLVPMLLFLCGPYTFFALPEHYAAPHNDPMVTATGSVRSNPVYRWLTLDGNFHLAHHVFPNASWWRLRDADAQLRRVTNLRYRGYIAFYRSVWRSLTPCPSRTPSTSSDNAAPAM